MADQDNNTVSPGSIRAQGRRKSNFPAKTLVESGAYLDYFVSGTNYKITFSDLQLALGVSGTLAAVGSITGTPVLTGTGSDYLIRTLENGSGVKASTSPENGITLDHNFVSGSGGVPILTDITEAQPKIRSIAGGDGIAVAAQNGSIVISTSDVPAGSKVIVINSADDFPAAVGGVRTLEGDTVYLLAGDIDVGTDRFMMQDDTTVTGSSSLVNRLSSLTTGELFTTSNGNRVSISNISINCPNAGIICHNATTPNTGLVSFDTVIIESCDHLGEFTNTSIITYSRISVNTIITSGITTFGTITALNFDTIVVADFSGVLVDLGTAMITVIDLENSTIFSDDIANVVLDGLPDSGNVPIGGHGAIRATNIIGPFTSTGNILPSDLRWDFQLNNRFPNSINQGYISMPTNVTETVISVAATPVKVLGVWDDIIASRFENDASGRMTYIGTRTIAATINFTGTAKKSGGGTDSFIIHVAKNGVPDANAIAEFATDNTRDPNVGIVAVVSLSTNDYIELFVENVGATNNVTITASNFVAVE